MHHREVADFHEDQIHHNSRPGPMVVTLQPDDEACTFFVEGIIFHAQVLAALKLVDLVPICPY
ncbi:MAG TPA: hypothetical protein VNW73_08160 [Ktedonobacteraceae bacterium]|nr:hypothetical protein [Ktedonobacteraceae bacterium]